MKLTKDYVRSYLNREDVQIAIHAVPNSLHNRKWQQCSSTLNYSRSDLLTPMLPVYEELLNEGLRLLVYSGDGERDARADLTYVH